MFLSVLGLISTYSAFSQEKFPFYVSVVTQGVNVRTDSTVNAEVIVKLNKGETVLVVKDFYDWYKITLPKSAPCYVFAKYISAMSEKIGVVNSENVNARLKPNTKAAILGKLKKGESVNIISFSDSWYLIEPTEETHGWIHKSVVKATELSVEKEKMVSPAPVYQKKEETKNILDLEGTIYDRGKTLGLFRQKITHKLFTNDNKSYLLTGNKYKFNMYANQRVRIKGFLITDLPNQEYPVIEVQELEKLN
ncbi:MAG: SH3 domain-containing protein [Candidatus Omnitrophica bacterium]|nr:SH3 domain-containing protein [Candidatus Omnitrophota bacterium]